MRHDLPLGRQVRRITAGTRREPLDIVGNHALQQGCAFAAGELKNPKPVFFSKNRRLSCSLVIFGEHINLYYIDMKNAVLVDDLFLFSKISATSKLFGSDFVFSCTAESV